MRIFPLMSCVPVAASMLLLAGVAGAQTTPANKDTQPEIGYTVKPDWLAFGYRTLNTEQTDTFWLRNKGTRPLRIHSMELRGSDTSPFSFTNNCGKSVPVDGQCRIDVTFKPVSTGEKAAELRVVAGDNEIRTRGLAGNAVRLSYAVEPDSLKFGRVPLNASSQPQTITIRNTGGGQLPLKSIEVGGENPQQFAVADDCPEHVVPEGRACTVRVVFKPTWKGGDMNANLIVTPGAQGEAKTVSLRGTTSE